MGGNMTIAEYEETWDADRIIEIENSMLQGIFGCRATEAVEAAVTYAKFLNRVGITAENYPVFLKLLEIENHWVIDALIGDRDPFLMFAPVQPNRYIVQRIFAMLTKWHKGGTYIKSLSVILGVLQSVYSSPMDGYRIYPLTIANLNALGKHLKKGNGQDDPLNRVVLEILERISTLQGQGSTDQEEIAIQASAIRNAFFDNRKKMEEVIPPVLLVPLDECPEIPPRRINRKATGQKQKLAPQKKQAPQKRKKRVAASHT
jgi:hypothetical protein